MKTSGKLLLLVLVVLAVFSASTMLFAQSKPFGHEDPQPIGSIYKVQPGDTLWQLAGDQLDDPLKWGKILGANPFLDEPGRVFEKDGKVIVLIKPGEELVIPDGLGIKLTLVPLSVLQVAAPPTAVEKSVLGKIVALPWWVIAVLGALAANAVYWYFRRRLSNPITSGPAVVPGGIRPDEGNRLRQEFQRMAAANFADQTGVTGHSLEIFSVEEVTTGRFSGLWVISYRGQSPRLKRMNGEAGYRARVRFPDEHEETLYSLQACFNPARMGERMFTRGGRFEEGEAVNTAPRPEPIRRRDEQPAFHPAAGEAPPTDTNSTTFNVGGHAIVVPAGTGVRTDGNRLIIQPPADSMAPIVVTFAISRKRKRAVAGKPAQPVSLARPVG